MTRKSSRNSWSLEWITKKGFLPYQLNSNNAEIRHLRSRLTVPETKAQLAETKRKKAEEIEGVKLVHNYEADRIRLQFDGKPDQETITRLRSKIQVNTKVDGMATKAYWTSDQYCRKYCQRDKKEVTITPQFEIPRSRQNGSRVIR